MSCDALTEIINNKDIDALHAVPQDVLEKHDHLLCCVIESDWKEGIEEYQKRFVLWSWVIKNCFTIFDGVCDPYTIFKHCPEAYRQTTIDSINSYGRMISDDRMIQFPATDKLQPTS